MTRVTYTSPNPDGQPPADPRTYTLLDGAVVITLDASKDMDELLEDFEGILDRMVLEGILKP